MGDLPPEKVLASLASGQIIVLKSSQWQKLAPSFPVKETVSTLMAGDILLVRRPLPGQGKKVGWALVEEPKTGERVIRPVATEKEARALIADRLAAYERMWDG